MRATEQAFLDGVREAEATILAATGRSAIDVVDDGDYVPVAIEVARALGFIEGAAVALGVTPLEMLDHLHG